MGTHRNQLDLELAQIAAGTRSVLSDGLSDAVRDQDSAAARDVQKRADAQTALLREASRQQEAAARALQDAADEQAAHHARLEDIEAERLALARKEVDQARSHRIRAQQALAAQGEQRALEARDREHAERLRTSPCFAAAHQLLELCTLEMAHRDREAIDAIYVEFVLLANEFRKDYEVARREMEPEFAAASDRCIVRLAQNDANTAELQAELDRIQGVFKAAEAKVGIFGWLPKARKERAILAEQHAEAQRHLSSAMNSRHLANEEAIKSTPAMLLAVFTKEFAHKWGVERRLKAIDAKIDTWLETAPRSPSALAFFDARGPLSTVSANKPIDFAVCAALDHARIEGGPVEYPGLGPLPFGSDLAATVSRIASLRAAGDPFATRPLAGVADVRWLLCALHVGVYEPSREMTATESSSLNEALGGGLLDSPIDDIQMPPVDPELYEQAKAIQLEFSHVSVSLLQRKLKIGYNKARGLYQALEADGLV